jgi:glycosyltransferase involved in cell wall biosynthesis
MIDIIIPTLKTLDQVREQIKEIDENTIMEHRIIATCQPESAAWNRNFGLELATSEIIIMVDDDMTGFFPAWEQALIEPLLKDSRVCMVSARLMTVDGQVGPNCASSYELSPEWIYVKKRHDSVMPSACIAFWDKKLRFDIEYIGSGWEDTDFCFQYLAINPEYEFVINNNCQLVHKNEMKNQWENGLFDRNKTVFYNKWVR